MGVCGKTDKTAVLQDMLIFALKGISVWGEKAREIDVKDSEAEIFVMEGLFTTVTNVNFDPYVLTEKINKAFNLRNRLRDAFLKHYEEKSGNKFNGEMPDAATWQPEGGIESYIAKGIKIGVLSQENEDVRSLREFLIYGLKGIAAYADHAFILNHIKPEITAFLQEGLAATTNDNLTADDLVGLLMKAGKVGVDTLALLDKANTTAYGIPEITSVYTGTKSAPSILVSGHDLLDFEELLKQTDGTGIMVYTHGEMLPANAYPAFKKYKHLAGNFGGAWYLQQKDFDQFGGVIVMTTNCIQKPTDKYKDRLFTTGLVAWPDVTHIADRKDSKPKDWSPVIKKALEIGNIPKTEGKFITIGFNHNTIMSVADKVVDAVKTGAIKRFVVMAGCDGRFKSREYFTHVAENLPKDTVILTAGCAKYRYNMLELGDIGGIPRIIDAGQCNDSYSLAVTALKLAEVFKVENINDLPISYDIAWYEQKAVIVLLALLYLGVKNIRLGPVLPAFVSPNVLKVLVEKFDIKPTGSVEEDIEAMMAGK
jgi:hydroxylamine reductase